MEASRTNLIRSSQLKRDGSCSVFRRRRFSYTRHDSVVLRTRRQTVSRDVLLLLLRFLGLLRLQHFTDQTSHVTDHMIYRQFDVMFTRISREVVSGPDRSALYGYVCQIK